MFYPTQLDEKTMLYLETETSGAFAKSDLEVRPDPLKALVNAVDLAKTFSRHLAREMKPVLTENNMDAEISFAVRCDGHGSVMIAMDTDKGQLACKLSMRSG